MQRNFLAIWLIIIFAYFSCSKIDETAFEDIPTELEVTILDDQNNQVSEAEVFLYRDRSSMDSRTGWVARDDTNADGIVTFTDLEPAQYFIFTFFEKEGSIYNNYKSNFALPVILRESALTKLEVQTAEAHPINPDTVILKGIHYPLDFNTDQNDGTCWMLARIIRNNESDETSTPFHVYDKGKILFWQQDYSQLLEQLYAEMEDMYPFNIFGFKLGISDVQSFQNDYTIALDHMNIRNVESNTIFFNLDEIIDDAINHNITYPNRMRVGITNTGHDELEFDLLLEWK